jgi:hypothetical protein
MLHGSEKPSSFFPLNPRIEEECVASEASALAIERRSNRRFPIALSLRYMLTGSHSGDGRVTDMSSRGILFQSDTKLPAGEKIHVILTWPFLLNGECPLQLRVRGDVLRSDPRGTVLRIQHYEFRTAPKVRAASAGAEAYTEERLNTRKRALGGALAGKA